MVNSIVNNFSNYLKFILNFENIYLKLFLIVYKSHICNANLIRYLTYVYYKSPANFAVSVRVSYTVTGTRRTCRVATL